MTEESSWWRSGVIYQIYPRSFADANGDGVGDLAGIRSRLDEIVDLGVDALWLSPITASPQRDAGYDVSDFCAIDPLFGSMADFDELIAEVHDRGLRLIMDLVPNHTSSDHQWFVEALASPPGSPERDRYHFVEGSGAHGDEPPNNWQSRFGGPAWTRVIEADGTPGSWYLHLFDSSQPDLNWENPWVREQFDDVLRFWLDRDIDGFRIDVAHGLIKAPGLPDAIEAVDADSMGADEYTPFWGQDGVHEIYRGWRELLATYPGERVLVAEAWVEPLSRLAEWVRPDEMHQAFNFNYLTTDWGAKPLREIIDESLLAFGSVGAPSTWVLSNHDVIRHATRLGLDSIPPQGQGIGPGSAPVIDEALGLRRARAATALMLALPGSAYVYQGEELGLPEVIDIPDAARQDPTWERTNHERYGRDGCRVPIPWTSEAPAHGFNETGESWLPQPAHWALLARDHQLDDPASTLNFYRRALRLRREYRLGAEDLAWIRTDEQALVWRVGPLVAVVNFGPDPLALPPGEVVLCSDESASGSIRAETAAWVLDAALM